MYNIGSYNRGNYNVHGGNQYLELSLNVKENIQADVYSSSDIYLDFYFSEQLKSNVKIIRTVEYDINVLEDFHGFATISPEIPLNIKLYEKIDPTINIGKNLNLKYKLSEKIKSSVYLGKDSLYSAKFSEQLNSDIYPSKEIFSNINVVEKIMSSTSIAFYDDMNVILNIEIPAGSELIIDSDNYTVYLDDENIFHYWKSGWIFLDRNVTAITVSGSGGSEFSGEILYRECYL